MNNVTCQVRRVLLRVGHEGGGRGRGRGRRRALQPVPLRVRALPHAPRGARRRHDHLLRLALLLGRCECTHTRTLYTHIYTEIQLTIYLMLCNFMNYNNITFHAGRTPHRHRSRPGTIDAPRQLPAEVLPAPEQVPEHRAAGVLRGDGRARLFG